MALIAVPPDTMASGITILQVAANPLAAALGEAGAVAAVKGTGIVDLVTILFMPAFFAFTGMRTEIGLLSGRYEWLVCGAIIAVAVAGKFGGTTRSRRRRHRGRRRDMARARAGRRRGLHRPSPAVHRPRRKLGGARPVAVIPLT